MTIWQGLILNGREVINAPLVVGNSVFDTDNGRITFGHELYASATQLGNDTTNAQMVLGLGTALGMQFIIGANAVMGNDYDHVPQTDPTLFIHSATNPNIANNEWLSLSHNATSAYFTSGKGFIICNPGITIIDYGRITMGGTSGGSILYYDPTMLQQPFFLGSAHRNLVIGDVATGLGKNFDHALSANPTLFIHSVTDPDVNNTQWVSLSHDATDGTIRTGAGSLIFTPASGFTTAAGYYFCYNGYLSNTGSGYYLGGATAPFSGIFDASTDTAANSIRIAVADAARIVMISDYADRGSNPGIAAQANPTLIIQSANAPAAQPTENVRISHNQTNGVITTAKGDMILDPATEITEVCGVGLKTKEYNATVNDDATISLPANSIGWGTIMIGDNQEFARFRWTAAAVVTLDESTANVITSDTDLNLCIFDGGTSVSIRNRLGANLVVRYVIHYS
jgi:hypothetical protein